MPRHFVLRININNTLKYSNNSMHYLVYVFTFLLNDFNFTIDKCHCKWTCSWIHGSPLWHEMQLFSSITRYFYLIKICMHMYIQYHMIFKYGFLYLIPWSMQIRKLFHNILIHVLIVFFCCIWYCDHINNSLNNRKRTNTLVSLSLYI